MRIKPVSVFSITILSCFLLSAHECGSTTDEDIKKSTIATRFSPPEGYERTPVEKGSFGEFLRRFPLKEGAPQVLLYSGKRKFPQTAHVAVLDIDIGDKNLQQCADAVIRLRAEYLWRERRFRGLYFNFTSGDRSDWLRWMAGWRPEISGNRVSWVRSATPDESYSNFRRWLNNVFTYAGTLSLSRDLAGVANHRLIQIGDVFVEGGSPGHAVLVFDVAEEAETGCKVFLLAQSFMPAQEIHILRNPQSSESSPWYTADFGHILVTPEWRFKSSHLRRFAE